MEIKHFVIFILCVVFLASGVFAADFDHVVVNSEEWTDVYSALQYSNLNGAPADFLVSEKHSTQVLEALEKNDSMMVLSSSRAPYVLNYDGMFSNYGYDDVQEISAANLNLELIKEMEDIDNFVIVSDDYGYNALAVIPYAMKTNAWVFFADENNIGEITDIINSREVNDVLVYGYVEPAVRDALESYSPDVIYNVNRFEDNIEIVEKTLELGHSEQVLLTNGEFIELELMSGKHPILFTGRENVPDTIKEYLKDSPLKTGVLIGNELVGAATNIRRSTGLFVMVKFARGARTQSSGVAAVEGLDLFPVPSPVLDLSIYSVEYNSLTQNLEVTYKSSSTLPIWIKGTIRVGEGQDSLRFGDNDSLFINPNNYKTVAYSVENPINFEGETANVFVLYGEGKNSLDRALDEDLEISTIDIIDNCEMDISSVSYDRGNDQFIIDVDNTGEVDCYVEGLIQNLDLDLETKTIGSEGVIKINSGDQGEIFIEQLLDEENLADNEFVSTRINFGERETSLIKSAFKEVELNVFTFGMTTYAVVALLLSSGLFFAIFLYKRRKEKKDFNI